MALDRLTQITSSGISSTSTITVSAVAGSITGVVTATSLTVTGNSTATNINASGIVTATGGVVGDVTGDLTGNVSSSGANTLGSLSVTNNATVGGALTVTGDLTVNGTTTTIDTAVTAVDSLAIDGAVTSSSAVVGSAVTINSSGINATGVITATSFIGDGSNLTGIDATQIVTGNTSVQTVDTGSDGHVKVTTEGTERLRIGSTGNVGIGTTNPHSRLYLKDSNTGYQLTVRSSSGNSGETGIGFNLGDETVTIDGYTKASILFKGNGTGNARGSLTFNINNVASGANVSSSDEKLRITSTGNVRVPDSGKFTCGDSDDLQIYHDGSNSYIHDNGTGSLVLRGTQLQINNAGNSQNYISAQDGGSVVLYHAGNAKLSTESTGIDVTGTVTCDGLVVDGAFTQSNGTGLLTIQDVDNTGSSVLAYAQGKDSAGTELWVVGQTNPGNQDLVVQNNLNAPIVFKTNNTNRVVITSDGHLAPNNSNIYDLGTSNGQWRNAYFDGTVYCDGLSVNGAPIIEGSSAVISLKDTDGTGGGTVSYVEGKDSTNTSVWYVGHASSGDNALYISNQISGDINFRTAAGTKVILQNAGHLVPSSNNNYDLGTSSLRWRNVYTNDLNLSNEGSTNDVDGTWGNYTIQEGEDDLFLINRRSGKKYKFMLQEVN